MVPFEHVHYGRNRKTLVILIGVYVALAVLYLHFDAAPLILGILAGFTLPALWDLYSNRTAGLTLDETSLQWHSGNRGGELALAEIEKVRLDTRLDLSVRASIIPHQGRKIRLPFEATPPHNAFEQALQQRNIKTERHHFNLFS